MQFATLKILISHQEQENRHYVHMRHNNANCLFYFEHNMYVYSKKTQTFTQRA